VVVVCVCVEIGLEWSYIDELGGGGGGGDERRGEK
jgi:hypothetical protein